MRKKLTIAQRIVILLSLAGVLNIILFLVLFHYKNVQEREIAKVSLAQFNHEVNSVISLHEASLKQVVFDYTYWDEFVNNIKPDNLQWFEENISTIVSSFHFDFVAVYDAKRNLIHEARSEELKADLIVTPSMLEHIYNNRFADFYTEGNGVLLAVSAATIHGTNDPFHTRTPVSGYLILAKRWDGAFFNELSGILGAKVSLINSDTDTAKTSFDRFTLTVTRNLNDFNKTRIGGLSISRHFPVLRLYDSIAKYSLGFILVLIALSLLLFYFALRRWVSAPLRLVSNVLRSEDQKSLNALKKSSEEFRLIALLFDNYLLQKEELVKAREKAEESDMLKSAFLANISHEIRTPMNGILGFTELLHDKTLDEKSRTEYLSIIERSGKQLLNLINDIIDVSKIEAGLMKIQPTDYSLNKVFRDVAMLFSNHEKVKKNILELKIKLQFSDEASWVRIDPLRLSQVLSNLVGNAVKFTQEGVVEFGYRLSADNQLLIFCKDSGIGIPAEKQTVIFDRFFQVNNTHSRPYEGTGLGLAISKSLAELMGGTLWVESVLDKGSTFYMTIPFYPVDRGYSEIFGETEYIDIPDLKGKKILIAEDVNENYQFLKAILEKTGAQVVWAKNGKTAVEMALQQPYPDLVLMDLKMPELNGYEATRLIKQQQPGIPVIAQTAYSLDGDRQKSIEAGCDDHIAKPILTTELYRVIVTTLANKNLKK